MSDTTLADTFVALCDWRGRLIWISKENPVRPVGHFLWEYVQQGFEQRVKDAVSRVVALGERQQYQVPNLRGEYYQVWMWPLDSPELAVCFLAMRVPSELELLTARELQCLQLLAHGRAPAEIAEALDISVSTVHTHFKRARTKLKLSGTEALISFAARHCYVDPNPLTDASNQNEPASAE